MYTIKLMNEFLHGPIWIYDEEKMVRRTYPLITDDEIRVIYKEVFCVYDKANIKRKERTNMNSMKRWNWMIHLCRCRMHSSGAEEIRKTTLSKKMEETI